MKELKKDINFNIKYIHITIIIIGMIFMAIPIFHTCLWFDEAYSVALANHSFSQIWIIGGYDVHPVLYYWILHIFNIIFGNNILVYRIFSFICMSILGIIGYTHIRKDFGEKVGLLFSFLIFFSPVNVVYAGEIRMYSLAMLEVMLTAIYAYRIYINKEKFCIKYLSLFTLFSLMTAYTHYYGLISIGLINLFLIIVFIKQSIRNKKVSKNLKAILISGMIQFLVYLPWIMHLIFQINKVSQKFWLGLYFPGTLIDMFIFQFSGNLSDVKYISSIVPAVYGILLIIYIVSIFIYDKIKKKKFNIKSPDALSILLYIFVIIIACIISIIINKSVIYARYLLCITGILMFWISYIIGLKGNKYINILICIITIFISIFININLIKINYNESNKAPFEYLSSQLQDTDALLYDDEGSGFVVATNFPNNKSYYWDDKDWGTKEEYKAFGTNMEEINNLDDLKDFHGRMWIINSSNYEILEKMQQKYDINIIEQKSFNTVYKNFKYTFALIQKD